MVHCIIASITAALIITHGAAALSLLALSTVKIFSRG